MRIVGQIVGAYRSLAYSLTAPRTRRKLRDTLALRDQLRAAGLMDSAHRLDPLIKQLVLELTAAPPV
jgi:hypothetical protein